MAKRAAHLTSRDWNVARVRKCPHLQWSLCSSYKQSTQGDTCIRQPPTDRKGSSLAGPKPISRCSYGFPLLNMFIQIPNQVAAFHCRVTYSTLTFLNTILGTLFANLLWNKHVNVQSKACVRNLLYLPAAQLSNPVDSLLQTSKQAIKPIKPSCSVALGKITNVTPEFIGLKGLFFSWQTSSAQIQILYQPADKKKQASWDWGNKIPLKNIFIHWSVFLCSLWELLLLTVFCKDFCRQCAFPSTPLWGSNHYWVPCCFYLGLRKMMAISHSWQF